MTAKEFNRLPLSAKTGIVMDYGKLVNERKEEDRFTIQTYSIKTEQVESIRFVEVKFVENIRGAAHIKMLRRNYSRILSKS
jgi:hypothetical protein